MQNDIPLIVSSTKSSGAMAKNQVQGQRSGGPADL